jgi:hypothetical protein
MANGKPISKMTKTEELCDRLVEYEDFLDDEIFKLNGIIADVLVIKGKIDAVVDGFMDGIVTQ